MQLKEMLWTFLGTLRHTKELVVEIKFQASIAGQ